jgi:hypothetical protein
VGDALLHETSGAVAAARCAYRQQHRLPRRFSVLNYLVRDP